MKTISFSLKVNSIDEAIEKVKLRKEWVESKSRELSLKVADLGARVARFNFSNAIYEGKNKMVDVSVVEKLHGYEIHANGEAVCFIEFGTGVGATSPKGAVWGFTPGSWSVDHERQFTENGFWHYGGKVIEGTPANNCMYDAGKEMEKQLLKIAREVFQK